MIAGRPISASASRAASSERTTWLLGRSSPILSIASRNRPRSSALSIASGEAPISSTPSRSSVPSRARAMAVLSAVWPPMVGRSASGRSRSQDLGDDRRRHRLDVGDVGRLRVGHDRGRVRVDQDHPIAFLAQRLAGLRAGIVELAGLADDDRPGAHDQDRAEVGTFGHGQSGNGPRWWCAGGQGLGLAPTIRARKRSNRCWHPRPRRGLGMVLDGEHRPVLEPDALDRAVEQRAVGDLDRGRQAGVGDREAVVLAGDLDLAGGQVLDRVVGAVMAHGHLLGAAAQRQAQHLMAEADAEHRLAAVDQLLDLGHGIVAGGGRVAGAVGQQRCRPGPGPGPPRPCWSPAPPSPGSPGSRGCAGCCASRRSRWPRRAGPLPSPRAWPSAQAQRPSPTRSAGGRRPRRRGPCPSRLGAAGPAALSASRSSSPSGQVGQGRVLRPALAQDPRDAARVDAADRGDAAAGEPGVEVLACCASWTGR